MRTTIIEAIRREGNRGTGVRWMALMAVALSGCATAGGEAFEAVREDVGARSGGEIQWHRDEAGREAAREAVAEILKEPLTADGAVEIALLNNRKLQAKYEELGLAGVDVAQARLPPNPVLSGSYLRSTNGGSGPSVEVAVVQNVIGLLMLPARRKMAEGRLEAVKADVSRQVLSLAAEVRAQFYTVQSDEQMLELMRHVTEATGAAEEVSLRMRRAGNITDLELARHQALHAEAKLHQAGAELQTMKSRERLNILLGLWGDQVAVAIEPRLPAMPESGPELEDIESRAVEASLALEALRHEIDAEGRHVGLTRATALTPELEAGVAFAREADGNRLLGPHVSLPIPLFDRGGPQVRRAEARLNQLVNTHYQQAVEVRAVARAARDHLRLAEARVRYMEQVKLPLATRITRETQLSYNAMQVGVFDLLRAKEEEIETGRKYVEALRDYWIARTEVDAVLQGHITEFGMHVTPLDAVPGSPLH